MANRSSKTHKREGKVTSAPVASSSSSSSSVNSSASVASFQTADNAASSSSSISVSDRRTDCVSNQNKSRSPIVTRSHKNEPVIVADKHNSSEPSASASGSKLKKRQSEPANNSSDKRIKVEQPSSSKAVSKSRKKNTTHFEVTDLSAPSTSKCKKPPTASNSKRSSAADISGSSRVSITKRFKKSHSSDNIQSNMDRQQHGSNNDNNNPPSLGNNPSGSSSSNASTPPLAQPPSHSTNTLISQIVGNYNNAFLEADEVSRLQTILESRGFSPNLSNQILGLPRVQHIFARSLQPGNTSRVQGLLSGLQPNVSASEKLMNVMELSQMLLMGNEDTLAGFPVKSVVPLLIQILQMDDNPELIHHAVRAMTYLMESLPRSSHAVSEAIPVFLQKLQTMDYMDVAEQTLSALETLSRRHHKLILSHNGIAICLQSLEFFPMEAQRSALAIVANCGVSMTTDDFVFLKDSLQILNSRLTTDDKKCIESTCIAFSRFVDCYQNDYNIISQIASQQLLQNIQTVLVTTPPLLSSESFISVIRMLSIMCSACSKIAVELLESNFVETMKVLLLSSNSNLDSETIHLASRSSQEIYELSALLTELLPVIPLSGSFEIDILYLKGSHNSTEMPIWQWKDERGIWQAFSPQENSIIEEAHLAGEDEFDVALGRSFMIDFNTMQRINDETNVSYPIQRKTSSPPGNHELANRLNAVTNVDPRIEWLTKKDESQSFLNFAFRVLSDVYNSSAGVTVRHKCLNGILRILYHTPKETLLNILQDKRMSSSIATMLSSTDYRTIVCAIQMCNILMEKSPQTFSVYFQREGVLHQMRKLFSPGSHLEEKSEPTASSSVSQSEDFIDFSDPHSSDHYLSRKSSLMDWPRSIAAESLPGTSAGKMRTRKKYYSKSKKESSSPSSSKASDLLSDASPAGTDSEIPSGSTTSSSKSGRPKEFLSRFLPTKLNRWNQIASASSSPNLPTTSTHIASREPVLPNKMASREKIRIWIIYNAKQFEKTHFSKPADGGDFVSSDVLNQLNDTIKLFEKDNTKALSMIKQILLESDLSLFEMIHSGLVTCLLNYFTTGDSIQTKENNIRLFLNVFCNIPLTDLIQNPEDIYINKNALQILISKLNGCISQVEQLPIRVQEFSQGSSSRGSQALKCLSTQSIKLSLIRHSSCTNSSSYKGSVVKMEPLIQIYQLERYMLQRGVTTLEADMESVDDEYSDEDGEHPIIVQSGSNYGRHRIQFLIGDNLLPYDISLFQAIKRYYPTSDSDFDHSIGSRFWSSVYQIHYRAVSSADVDSMSNTNSLGRNRSKGAKGSKASKKKDELWLEGKTPKMESPFAKYLEKGLSFTFKDECLEALNLMKIMFGIVRHWTYLYHISNSMSPLISPEEFVNQKLTMKANRQLQDVVTILIGQIPNWITEIAYSCPFVFPFDTRHSLFHIASFDQDRALLRYIENNSAELNGFDWRHRYPRFEKRKRTVSRADLFRSAESQIFNDFLNPRNLLEISYENEVGTGLGPTLEFYSLLSKEFQRNDFEMWRVDQTPPCDSKKAMDPEMNNYVFSHNGLFPSPIGRGIKAAVINKLKSRFRFLGKFVAKALMDSRLIDIPLNIVFYKWLLDEENTLNILDMHHVDSSFANSLLQMNRIAQRKLKMDLNHQDDLLKLHGCAIEDLNLEFTLPGYPNIELKKNGRDQAVMLSNLESYLNLVSHWMLFEGVSKQLEAFRDGFNSVFSLSHLKIFYPEELQKLFCGTPHSKWDIPMLMKSTKTDHGYSHDSRAIKFLFEIMSEYNVEEQRRFLMFITGCPRLPIGGFRALSPPLTIVKKTAEQLDHSFLPSVMTCANYLKLPDYPTLEMMREKLAVAISEGQGSFHLS